MKHIKMFLLVAIMLIVPTMLFAQGEQVDLSAMSIVEMITPFIVLGVSAFMNWITPKIPGWAMLMIVTAVSAAVAWVTGMLVEPDLSWLMQFLYGLLAVVLHQFYKKLIASTA